MLNHKISAAKPLVIVREPESIYQIRGEIVNGTFNGRWHFSFGDNYDSGHTQFGTLRVFNDDTLSSGAVWPLHPHHDIEVVTYCAEGEFRHAYQRGKAMSSRKDGYSTPRWEGACGTRRSTTNPTYRCASSRCGLFPLKET